MDAVERGDARRVIEKLPVTTMYRLLFNSPKSPVCHLPSVHLFRRRRLPFLKPSHLRFLRATGAGGRGTWILDDDDGAADEDAPK